MSDIRRVPEFHTPEDLTVDLQPGVYEISVSVREATTPGFFTIEADGAEIGCGAVPARNNPQATQRTSGPGPQWHARDRQRHLDMVKRWHPPSTFTESSRTLHTWTYPLYRQRGGTVALSLRAHQSYMNDEVLRYCAEDLRVESLLIRKVSVDDIALRIPEPLRHQPLVPIWGWMSMTSFDHPDSAVSTPEELRTRAIDESAAWGATGFEFLPVNRDGLSFDPVESTAERNPSSSSWPVSSDRTWTAFHARELLRHAQSKGMASFLFLYTLYGLSALRAGSDYLARESFLNAILESLHAAELLNGVILEGWLPVEPSRLLPMLKETAADTALFVSVESGEQIDGRDLEFSPDAIPYIAHWATFSVQHTGFDHSYPHAPFPASWYREVMGSPCFYMQGCAQTHHPRKRFPRISPDCSIGVSNRTVSPDWIAAQIVSFSEMNLQNPDDIPAAAVCWEADEPTMAPEAARRYMYALSQDPYRACYACSLDDTGAGGEIDLKRETRRIRPEEVLRLRRRHPYPATCTVLRNRFLELILFPGRDYSVLRSDLSGRGRYYHNGACTVSADPVFITRVGDLRNMSKTIEIAEPAGPTSIVVENLVMSGSGVQFSETRRFQLLADTSELLITAHRRWDQIPDSKMGPVESFIGLRGRRPGRVHAEDGSWSVELYDARGSGRPPCTVTVRWNAGASSVSVSHEHDGLVIRHRPVLRDEHWRVSIQTGDSPTPSVVRTEAYRDKPLSIESAPALLRVKCAPHGPVYVGHNGVWRARPSAVSAEHDDDVLIRLGDFAPDQVTIRFEDYLYSWIRAGSGSRYLVEFTDVTTGDECVSATIAVGSLPAFMKTVRIESLFSLADLHINGKDWKTHHDRKVVFLPPVAGTYTMRARR